MFTEDTVILRDTKPARLQYFVLEREPWVKKGIEAYQALRTGTEEPDPQEAEGFHRAYATMQHKLGPAVSAKVRDRLPGLEHGATWDIAAATGQVLLARAWLRLPKIVRERCHGLWTHLQAPSCPSTPRRFWISHNLFTST